MIVNNIYKYKNVILFTIGILLIIISFCLLFYDRLKLIKDNVYNEVELLKYHESNDVNNYSNEEEVDEPLEIEDVETEEISDNENENNTTSTTSTTNVKKEKEYIGYLEIDKINLKLGMVSKNSYYNNVNRNIQLLSASDYPDKENGNTIIAGHSGTGYLGYFKNLYKLSIGDIAKIYYKQKIYTYKIVNIYNVPKVGKISVNRDSNKTCLTLITCTHNSKTEQTVYILELISKESEAKL